VTCQRTLLTAAPAVLQHCYVQCSNSISNSKCSVTNQARMLIPIAFVSYQILSTQAYQAQASNMNRSRKARRLQTTISN
jgi:hypothetical protein